MTSQPQIYVAPDAASGRTLSTISQPSPNQLRFALSDGTVVDVTLPANRQYVARGPWAPLTAYGAGDLVTYGGQLYSANAAFTSGAAFVASNWTLSVAKGADGASLINRGLWAPSTAYGAGDLVSYQGRVYSAKAVFTSAATFNVNNWTLMVDKGADGRDGLNGTGAAFATVSAPNTGRPRVFNRSKTERVLIPTPAGKAMRELGNICYDPTSPTPYRLYYILFTPPYAESGMQQDTYVATSVDGKTWTPGAAPIITGRALEDNFVYKTPQGWEMYAEDKSVQFQKYMAAYRSPDGLTGWTYLGNLGIPATAGSYTAVDVSSPINWMEGTRRYCLYEGRANGQSGAIGLAYTDNPDPTQPWTLMNGGNPVATGTNAAFQASNPTFYPSAGPTVAWSSILVPDDLIKSENMYWMLCHGYTIPDNRYVPILLTSPDLINWYDIIGSELINPDSATAPGETWMWGDPDGTSIYFTSDNQTTAQVGNTGIKLARTRFEQTYGDMYHTVYDVNKTGVVDNSQRLNGVLAASYLRNDTTQTVTGDLTFNRNGGNAYFRNSVSGKTWHLDVGSSLFNITETGVADALTIDPGTRTVKVYGAALTSGAAGAPAPIYSVIPGQDRNVTVTGPATTIGGSWPANTAAATIQVTGGDILFTLDGSAPSSATAKTLTNYTIFRIETLTDLNAFKAAPAVAGTTPVLSISPEQRSN